MIPLLVTVAGLLVGALAAHAAETIMARRAWQSPDCPYCQAPYGRFQWSATLACFTGKHHCRACGEPLRWPRLAGELFLAATWGLLAARYGLAPRVFLALAASVPLAMVLVTDLEAKLIPNRIILPAVAAMLVAGSLLGPAVPGIGGWVWWHPLVGGGIGYLVFWSLYTLGVALLGEGALGAGDVKLAAFAGLAVGYPLVIEALLLAVLLGGVAAVFVLVVRRSLRAAFPYGPSLVLGCAVTMIYGMEIARWFWG